jgi:hypothetical protein
MASLQRFKIYVMKLIKRLHFFIGRPVASRIFIYIFHPLFNIARFTYKIRYYYFFFLYEILTCKTFPYVTMLCFIYLNSARFLLYTELLVIDVCCFCWTDRECRIMRRCIELQIMTRKVVIFASLPVSLRVGSDVNDVWYSVL